MGRETNVSSDKLTKLHTRKPGHDNEREILREKLNLFLLQLKTMPKGAIILKQKLITLNRIANVDYVEKKTKRLIT